jgi:hypothetical protein
MPILSFTDAIAQSTIPHERHLLIGNGFSCALDGRYRYDSLYNETVKTKLVSWRTKKVFNQVGTSNFEEVLLRFYLTKETVSHYWWYKFINDLNSDAENLKKALIKVLQQVHHDQITSIPNGQLLSAFNFFCNFQNVFTLNYDLLPYWISLSQGGVNRPFKDQFGILEDDFTFKQFMSDERNLVYLHGGLHIYRKGAIISKIRSSTHSLMSSIEEVLEDKGLPVFVAEGRSKEKSQRIKNNYYLDAGFRFFKLLAGDLFIFGFSFGQSDSHFIEAILKNTNIRRLFISTREPNDSAILRRLEADLDLLKQRYNRQTLAISFFDAVDFNPWNN